MLDKIKAKMFPCTERMNLAIEENCKATERLIKACAPKDWRGNQTKFTFPELQENKIVSPS